MDQDFIQGKKRLAVLLIVSLLLIVVIFGKMFYIHIIKNDEYTKRALNQWFRGFDIQPKRGSIYDKNGKRMAISVNSHTLWANPKDIEKQEDINKVAKQLSKVLKEPEKEIMKKLKTDSNSVKLKQWLEKDEVKELKKLNIYGVQVVDGSRRYYPYKNLASHVIGFTNIDNVGLNGIEKTYDRELSGIPGKTISTVYSGGKKMPDGTERIFKPEDGDNLVLTIDQTIQEIVEKEAEKLKEESKAKNISIIVMDPKNSDILAMVNNPNFDLNNPREPLDEESKKEWEKLPQEELQQKWYDMWRNPSISDSYEPGSTFKTIIAAAAIEENIANPESHFYCSGFVKGTPLKCSSWYNPHKEISLKKGFASSCNIVFVDLGKKLGKEKVLKYIKAFGFGEKTGIELLGEQAGIVASSPEVIRDINLATMSYGHGVAVTPLQLVNAISAIANEGKLMQPRLVSKVVDKEGKTIYENKPKVKRQVISKATSSTVLKMMKEVVDNGTGGHSYIQGYRVGGKTGTAQKIIDRAYAPGKYIGSYVAVAPVDDPQLSILVVVDEPEGVYYGGSIAAPTAGRIIEKSLKYLEVEPVYTEEEQKAIKKADRVPNVVGLTLEQAGKTLIDKGFRYSIETDIRSKDLKIVEQFPEPGTELKKGSIVDLYIEESLDARIDLPDLKGKSRKEVVDILDQLGLKYQIVGEGRVFSQSPPAKSSVTKNTSIKIELENKD